tara:strand:+ start:503 stop:700 length:198 start_codon:yes stop_codon:yes gene_type:complete
VNFILRRRTMTTIKKWKTPGDDFAELLGEEVIFFNKDEGTDTLFYKRENALEHDEECECLECENI